MKNTRQRRPEGSAERRRWIAVLGLAALYVQALLPLLVAIAAPAAAASEHRAHAHAARLPHHAPADPGHHPGRHPGHGDCVLCLGLQLGGPAALPAAPPLPVPAETDAAFAVARRDNGTVVAASVHYASRAPPQRG